MLNWRKVQRVKKATNSIYNKILSIKGPLLTAVHKTVYVKVTPHK